MKYKMPNRCPVCGNRLTVTRLCCYKCSTVIEGRFRPCEFCNLPSDELEFIKTFIKCRGSIKEVEKELGISYPTVRSKLDAVIKDLGFEYGIQDNNQRKCERQKNEILDQLSRNEITPQEAIEKIKKL